MPKPTVEAPGSPQIDAGGSAPPPVLRMAGVVEILDGVVASLSAVAFVGKDRPADATYVGAARRARVLTSRAAGELRRAVKSSERSARAVK